MKAILMSIKPKHVVNILNGIKDIEARKNAPKEWEDFLDDLHPAKEPEPRDVFLYCTKDGEVFYEYKNGKKRYIYKKRVRKIKRTSNGVVIAKFTLRKVEKIIYDNIPFSMTYNSDTVKERRLLERTCLDWYDMDKYFNKKEGRGWFVEDLEIFDEPKELSEFGLKRSPQSWCYVEV